MITRNGILDALTVLSGNASDKTPDPAEITIRAWVDHFTDFPRLEDDDLHEAVRLYCRQPRDRLVQPQDLSLIAVELVAARAATEGAPDSEDTEVRQTLCREALSDAKSGDAAALSWLVKEFDWYGKCAVLWASKRKIDWRNPVQLSGGPVNGERGGVGAGGGWERTRRPRTPDHLFTESARTKLDKELRQLLTEDEQYQVFGTL